MFSKRVLICTIIARRRKVKKRNESNQFPSVGVFGRPTNKKERHATENCCSCRGNIKCNTKVLGLRSFNSLSYQYLRGASTIREIVATTCAQLWSILQPLFMPSKEEQDWIEIADEFYRRTNFPNVIGAVDGKHPNDTTTAFRNFVF
ncbi:unnamed protein product [Acanthoscelides obtectus]|uniref:Uncharacterized protein n=1 Tax=Acanthoscelides obtectus TaxID=200917 RepID=A0A9P0LK40_ACAOB|nr:unnamed protein product [Acanthoscelides obtectus]CAK1624382.1 hypothetical protein AOBTE_LOCUS2533 [Acanthoscelides obtectus]